MHERILTTALCPRHLFMRNSAEGTTSQWYQSPLVRGAIACLVLSSGLFIFGRDSLFFYNGPGGNGWNIGGGGLHVFNAHFERDLEQASQKALQLVNRDREANGLPPLVADARLTAAAQSHAEDMARRDFLSSFSPEGKAPSDRLVASGGSGFAAENIAVQDNDDQVTYRRVALFERGWMYERRDRENLLNPQFEQFGFGIAVDAEDGETYAVQMFRSTNGLTAKPVANAVVAATEGAADLTPASSQSGRDPFREAVNAAMAAAVAAQTADSPQAWAEVARGWQQAIADMKAVAPTHPRYETAQQKATEYGKNFDYARTNAGAAFVPQAPASSASAPSAPALSREATEPSLNEQDLKQEEKDAAIVSTGWNFGVKLFLTLGGAGLLIFILTLDPSQAIDKDSEEKAPRGRPSPPWSQRAAQEVQQFLKLRGWLNRESFVSSHGATPNRPVQRVHRKLYRELLNLTQDEQAAIGLLKESMRRNPRQPANWCCEQVIKDLRKHMPPPNCRSFRRTA